MLMGTQKRGSTSPLKGGLPPLINPFPKASTSPFKLTMPSVSIPQAPGKPPVSVNEVVIGTLTLFPLNRFCHVIYWWG